MNNLSTRDRLTGSDGWAPLLKQWKIGVLVALLSFGAACTIITQLTPVYKAYVQLLLPLKLVEDPDNRKSTGPQQADALVAKSFADLIQDNGVARTVIHSLDLEKDPEFQPHRTWLTDAIAKVKQFLAGEDGGVPLFSDKEIASDRVLQDYAGRLKVVAESKALTILLSFQAQDPHLAERVVTAHANAFVQNEVDARRRDAEAKAYWMKAELDRTAAEARDAQVAIQLNPTALTLTRDLSASAVSVLKMRQLQATATQAVYDSVLKRYQDLIADESYAGSEIRIVSAATVPTHPYFPKNLLFAAVAAVLSVLLGLFAAVIATVVRRRISIDAIVEMLGLPILARVNVPGATWAAYGQRARMKRALFWQRIHELRSTINVTVKRHPVILVTSVMPKEGKSLVASALARTLASSGLRTLLIDLNGRNSRYQLSLDRKTAPSFGLVDYLEGSATAGQAAVQVDGGSPLFLMTNRGTKATYLAAFSGSKLRTRLAALKKVFDAVVIDAAALESLSDSLQLAAYTDEIVLAVLADTQQLNKLKDDVAKIRARSARLRGVIIVDKTGPNAEDLACIRGYVLSDILRDIWPKAKPMAFFEMISFKKLLGRGAKADNHAEASI